MAIQANTIYVASYYCPHGHYSGNLDYFAHARESTRRRCTRCRPACRAATACTPTVDQRTFPTLSYRALNYWVDVLFNARRRRTLTSIAVTPAGAVVTVGAHAAVHGDGYVLGREHAEPDDSGDVGRRPRPRSRRSARGGLATAVSAGTTTISATLGAVSGSTVAHRATAAPIAITTTSLPGGTVGVPLHDDAGGHRRDAAVHVVDRQRHAAGGSDAQREHGGDLGDPDGDRHVELHRPGDRGGAQTATKALGITVSADATVRSGRRTRHRRSIDAGADAAVELGVKFRSDVAGYITGIRFYKSAANSGPHTGPCGAHGTSLATATFNRRVGLGLAAGDLRQPGGDPGEHDLRRVVPLPERALQRQPRLLRDEGVDTPPLHALADGGSSGGNGVYAYGATSTFPTITYRTLNYWVDVVFSSTVP